MKEGAIRQCSRRVRAMHVKPSEDFGIGASETVMMVPGLGNAWDVDHRTGGWF